MPGTEGSVVRYALCAFLIACTGLAWSIPPVHRWLLIPGVVAAIGSTFWVLLKLILSFGAWMEPRSVHGQGYLAAGLVVFSGSVFYFGGWAHLAYIMAAPMIVATVIGVWIVLTPQR